MEYEICVKGPRGRKWFAAGFPRSENREELEGKVNELQGQYLDLNFEVLEATVTRKLAERYYRPWESTGIDQLRDRLRLN